MVIKARFYFDIHVSNSIQKPMTKQLEVCHLCLDCKKNSFFNCQDKVIEDCLTHTLVPLSMSTEMFRTNIYWQ